MTCDTCGNSMRGRGFGKVDYREQKLCTGTGDGLVKQERHRRLSVSRLIPVIGSTAPPAATGRLVGDHVTTQTEGDHGLVGLVGNHVNVAHSLARAANGLRLLHVTEHPPAKCAGSIRRGQECHE